MAPEGEEPVVKMKQYSTEFNAGQIQMVLVQEIFPEILMMVIRPMMTLLGGYSRLKY